MKKLPPWYRLSPARLELERSILGGLEYFRLEAMLRGSNEVFKAVGLLHYRRERSGREESFRVGVEYPFFFPRDPQRVFDHEKRFPVGPVGHLMTSHQLCLTLPERHEFELTSQSLTEQVLGASLVWFDKRLIYERTKKWPGPWERHGAWGKLDLILEKARLTANPTAVQWAEQLLTSAVTNGRRTQIDVYSPCPCGEGPKLKFCHYKDLGSLFKLVEALSNSSAGLDAK